MSVAIATKHVRNTRHMTSVFYWCAFIGLLHKFKYSFNAPIWNILSSGGGAVCHSAYFTLHSQFLLALLKIAPLPFL